MTQVNLTFLPIATSPHSTGCKQTRVAGGATVRALYLPSEIARSILSCSTFNECDPVQVADAMVER